VLIPLLSTIYAAMITSLGRLSAVDGNSCVVRQFLPHFAKAVMDESAARSKQL
jgi:hypothetical protein